MTKLLFKKIYLNLFFARRRKTSDWKNNQKGKEASEWVRNNKHKFHVLFRIDSREHYFIRHTSSLFAFASFVFLRRLPQFYSYCDCGCEDDDCGRKEGRKEENIPKMWFEGLINLCCRCKILKSFHIWIIFTFIMIVIIVVGWFYYKHGCSVSIMASFECVVMPKS